MVNIESLQLDISSKFFKGVKVSLITLNSPSPSLPVLVVAPHGIQLGYWDSCEGHMHTPGCVRMELTSIPDWRRRPDWEQVSR